MKQLTEQTYLLYHDQVFTFEINLQLFCHKRGGRPARRICKNGSLAIRLLS